MPKRALLYIGAVTALGAVILSAALISGGLAIDPFFAASLMLGAAVSAHKVKLPGVNGTISGGFAFILLAIGKFGWEQIVLMAVVTALVQSCWRTRQTAVQVAFNTSTVVICAVFANGFAEAAMPGSEAAQICLACLLLYVTNTLMVSLVICLLQRGSFTTLWDTCRFWAFPYYLAGGAISACLITGTGATPAWLSLMIAPAVIMVASHYRQYVTRALATA